MEKDRRATFLVRIRKNLHIMHPAERRLADYLLNFPGELASYTATELAQLAQVSKSTVTRFVKRLGYSSYDEARRQVRSDKKTGAAIYLVEPTSARTNEILLAHILQARENLELTFSSTSLAEMDQLAQAILDANRVWVVGFRTSFSFASYFQWQVLQVIDNIFAIPRSGQTLAEHISCMNASDCVVFFSLQRKIRKSDHILKSILQTGANVALISDAGVDRNNAVKWHFKCGTASPGPLFSHGAVVTLLHIIAERVFELAGQSGRKRLTVIESLHDDLDEI